MGGKIQPTGGNSHIKQGVGDINTPPFNLLSVPPLANPNRKLEVTQALGGTSLVVQWLRLQAPNAGGPGSIPGQGSRPYMPQLRLSTAKEINIKEKNNNNSPKEEGGRNSRVEAVKMLCRWAGGRGYSADLHKSREAD